jgi:hypothetical protein
MFFVAGRTIDEGSLAPYSLPDGQRSSWSSEGRRPRTVGVGQR